MAFNFKPSNSFLERADPAAYWEAWVSAVLTRMGLHVLHYPFVCDGKAEHATTWDLLVARDFDPVFVTPINEVKLAVKGISLTFNGPDDYPFDEVLVCSHSNFKAKWGPRDYLPRDFMLVSKITGSIVWVPAMTETGLKVVKDPTRKNPHKSVTVHKENLRTLPEFVEEYWPPWPKGPSDGGSANGL